MRFGATRDRLYAKFSGVLRAHDNAAGAVGEYFAIREFNRVCLGQPLIRCSSSDSQRKTENAIGRAPC
jgi:hypothetical protein